MEEKIIKKALMSCYKKFIKDKEIIKEEKGKKDFVSNIDKSIELYLISVFKKYFPNFKYISEEFNPDKKELDKVIVIDPIDGTCNFINNINLYGIQIAFIENNEITLSAIYLPTLKEFYFAKKGLGAYLNGKRLLNDKPTKIDNTIVSIGDFSRNNKSTLNTQVKIIDNLKDKVMKIKMFGSASIDMAFVSSRRTNGYVSFATNIWDYASGILIARESGLIVKSLEKDTHDFNSKSIVIADSEELANIIQNSIK